jgi:hypothetical protein
VCQDLPHLACDEGLRSIDGRERVSSNVEAMFWTHRERYRGLVRHMEESGSDLLGAGGEVCGV